MSYYIFNIYHNNNNLLEFENKDTRIIRNKKINNNVQINNNIDAFKTNNNMDNNIKLTVTGDRFILIFQNFTN